MTSIYPSLICGTKPRLKSDPIERLSKSLQIRQSYGIFIEINRDDTPKSQLLNVYGPNGDCFEVRSKVIEEPGRFFNPLLGVLITGAARLMLALAEQLTIDFGLDWSFAIRTRLPLPDRANSPGLNLENGWERLLIGLSHLIPTQNSGSILQIEKINFGIDSVRIRTALLFRNIGKAICVIQFGPERGDNAAQRNPPMDWDT